MIETFKIVTGMGL